MATSFAALLCLAVAVTALEGSGAADQNVWIEYKDTPITFNYINNALSEYVYRPINTTLQLEIIRAEEEIRRGRISITLWAHQVWHLREKALYEALSTLWSNRDVIKVVLDHNAQLTLSPQAVFKNALYFKEHYTPLRNTIFHAAKNGRFSLHSKFTIDIPCVRIFPMKLEYIEYPICGKEITLGRHGTYRSSNDVVCEMRFGSYVRDKSLLNLDWAFNAIDGHSSPCSNELIPHCLIQEIQTFRRETEFIGEKFDELIACFLLSYRTADRWGGA
ncbi:hypothetical protein Tcan_14274 [Toxocara canis]|nr:hypothetical protein Tcan_14274 [Toxocara canis]